MRKNANKSRNILKDCAGATAVEAAFIFPIILACLFGFFSLGAYYQGVHGAKRTTEKVARDVRLLSMPEQETIKKMLVEELPKPLVGTYVPEVSINDSHDGGSMARIYVTYKYQLGLPAANGGTLGLNLKSVSDTSVKLRNMPSAG